jgi:peptidoglycan/xylan/chitin deacetylase (PgdA/CDA1 family)
LITIDKPALFGKTTPLIEMPVSWTLDDHPHFEFIRTKDWILPGLMNTKLVLENWINDYGYMKKNLKWGVIIYTFHPFVIGRGGRMLILEKLITKLKDSGAVFTKVETAAAEYEKKQPFTG